MGGDTLKCCINCKETKPYNDFYHSKSEKDGYGYRCKSCDYSFSKKYRLRDIHKHKAMARNRYLKSVYGISSTEYNYLLVSQEYNCAICKRHYTLNKGPSNKEGIKHLSVDHDHKTGNIRGLLCNDCNRGLGLLQDSEETLQQALNYLRRNNH